MNWFEIQPTEWEQGDGEIRTNTVEAISHAGKALLKYQLVQEPPFKVQQKLVASPDMKPDEILAAIYFGRKFAELSAGQQETLTKKRSSFAGWTNTEPSQVASAKAGGADSKAKPKVQAEKPEPETPK
jgi:hypothetical protein